MKEISYDGPSFDERTLNSNKKIRSRGSKEAPTVRTFRGDVEELIQKKGTTKTEVVSAEAARREARGESRVLHAEESHLGRIIFLLLLVLTFGIGVGVYVLFGTKGNVAPTATVEEKPRSAEALTILLTDSPREQVMADIALGFGKTSLRVGGMRSVSFTTKNPEGTTQNATTTTVLTHVALSHIPETLLHSLNEVPVYGIYAASDALSGYFLFTTRSYPNTFGGMLEWEANMAKDMMPSLHPWYARKKILDLQDRAFTDERILDVDARVLRDADGTPLIAYVFVSKKTLVITGALDALRDIITHVEEESAL